MAQEARAIFTLTQHTEGYRGDAPWRKRAVEEACCATCTPGAPSAAIREVVTEGGLIFVPPAVDDWNLIREIVRHENWPPELAAFTSSTPHARGTFSTRVKVNGVPLYVRLDKTARDALWVAWLSANPSVVNQICLNAIGYEEKRP